VTSALLLLLFAAPPRPLEVGDPAPPIQVETWVKGEPLEAGKVTLVEFWATWCPPCISAAPHLSNLQCKYPDLQVVAVTALDEWGSTRPAIEKAAQAMSYRVGIDAVAPKAYQGVFGGKTEVAYLQAAEVEAIPSTFVIDRQGRIAYIGLPTLVDDPLAEIMAGQFDLAKARKASQDARKADEMRHRFEALIKESKWAEASKLGWQVARANSSARTLWIVAFTIIDIPDKNARHRDLKLARECAARAVEASRRQDPGMLSTLAGVCFLEKKTSETQSLLQEAYNLAVGEQRKGIEADAARYGCHVK
jgi:thiol-disulfide isomerase/thioredoxin